MSPRSKIFIIAIILISLLAGCKPPVSVAPTATTAPPSPTSAGPAQTSAPTLPPAATSATPTGPPDPTDIPQGADPYALVSQEHLFAFLEGLTAIQPYSGWRNSASSGESEAIDYVEARLDEMAYLAELGLALERQSFNVYLGTELWETRFYLTVNGETIEAPADGLRGPRDNIQQALRFDSDGQLNDSERNPQEVEGAILTVRSADEIEALSGAQVRGKIVFLDYAVVDRIVTGDMYTSVSTAWELLEKGPAALVLVTQNSMKVGESHGFGVGDVSALNWVETQPPVPILYARIEDLSVAGVSTWDDLASVEAASLVWDADIFSPATSWNLAARIPGQDSAKAVILGAHIDSPNSPGALDDGSGSVILLETARVLNAAQVQPPVDLYLVWFGSEELGLYGAGHFAAAHQELLDRTLAMLEIDDLTRPLDGLEAEINLTTWSYDFLGDGRLAFADFLSDAGIEYSIDSIPLDLQYLASENAAFSGFGVPNADMIYQNEEAFDAAGGWHYAAHVHDPYDTVELAREVGDMLEQMARLTLAAALETGKGAPELQIAPPPQGRAVFVSSYTEAIHMNPTAQIEMGMTLTWEGLDVDMLPYGSVVVGGLDEAAMVIVLPPHDYPSPEGDVGLYDKNWSQADIEAVETYVANGGLLVLTNSAYRLKYYNRVLDPNEDWADLNPLAERFGVAFQEGLLSGETAQVEASHPLVEGINALWLTEGNGVPFTFQEGLTLAKSGSRPAAVLIDYGENGGQVLVLADVGLLGNNGDGLPNLEFWRNLARYALER